MIRITNNPQTRPKISKNANPINVRLFGGRGALPVRTAAITAMSAVSRNGNNATTTKTTKESGFSAKFPRGPVRSEYPTLKITASDTTRKNTGERIGYPYIIHPRSVGTGHRTHIVVA